MEHEILSILSEEALKEIAIKTSSEDLQSELAKDKYRLEVRYALASNPNISFAVSEELAHNRIPLIRIRLAANPSIHIRILRYLSEDERRPVRDAVRYNPSMTWDILNHMECVQKARLSDWACW